jgi:predicted anti-sigma-YlaC factor YlaD
MKQKCTIKEEELLLWHYRELPAARQSHLKEHLADCADCRRRLDGFSATLEAFVPEELPWTPADQRRMTRRVTERLAGQPRMAGRLWFGTAAAAAMVLLVVVAGPWRAELTKPLPTQPAALNTLAELELLENLEFWQAFELLQELDFLEELEPLG